MDGILSIGWEHLIILTLASFRLTHLLVFDEITSFIRDPFLEYIYEADNNGEVIQRIEMKGSGLRYWVGMLLSCHWCIGIWSSAAVLMLYWFVPATFPIFLILAIAGAAAIIESKL